MRDLNVISASLLKGLIILTAGVLVTCGPGELTRDRAAELVRESEKFLEDGESRSIVIGRLIYDQRHENATYGGLEDARIITVKPHPETYVIWYKLYDIELTPQGKELAKDWRSVGERDKVDFGVKLREVEYIAQLRQRNLIAITGVASNASSKEAEVEFKWNWAPTLTGKTLGLKAEEDSRSGKAFLILYDDGWRISELSFQ